MAFNDASADTLQRVTQNYVMDRLRTELNNVSGTYYAANGNKKVVVTSSAEVFSAAYKQGDGQPVVGVMMGKCEEQSARNASGGNVLRRWELGFNLDMSMSDHASQGTEPASFVDNDRKLVDAVRAIVSRSYDYFSGLSMEGLTISADTERQSAGIGRNPMVISFEASTLTTD